MYRTGICVLVLFAAAGMTTQGQRLSYFPLETGNSWTYHVTVQTLSHQDREFDSTISVGLQILAPNGKRYFETDLGLLRTDSSTGSVWKYYPHPTIPLNDSTQHCSDTTEIEFVYLAADSGDSHWFCGSNWDWVMSLSDTAEPVGQLNIDRRTMRWGSWVEARFFADSIGMCHREFSTNAFQDYNIWELKGATVYGHTYTPVQLQSFTAEWSNGSVRLRWVTVAEINNMGFEVQRRMAADWGQEWMAIGFVPSSGSLNGSQYSYTDGNLPTLMPGSSVEYRLRQIDYSGEAWYSPMQRLQRSAAVRVRLDMAVLPMPVRSSAVLRVDGEDPSSWKYQLYDIHGRRIAEIPAASQDSGPLQMPFTLDGYPAGTYVIVASRGNERSVKPFVFLP